MLETPTRTEVAKNKEDASFTGTYSSKRQASKYLMIIAGVIVLVIGLIMLRSSMSADPVTDTQSAVTDTQSAVTDAQSAVTDIKVEITDTGFVPDTLVIAQGSTVTFENVAQNGSDNICIGYVSACESYGSGPTSLYNQGIVIASGQTADVEFDNPGTFTITNLSNSSNSAAVTIDVLQGANNSTINSSGDNSDTISGGDDNSNGNSSLPSNTSPSYQPNSNDDQPDMNGVQPNSNDDGSNVSSPNSGSSDDNANSSSGSDDGSSGGGDDGGDGGGGGDGGDGGD